MVAAQTHPEAAQVVTDMCCCKKRRLDNGQLVRRPTRLLGTPEICENMNRRCDGSHTHSVIEGSMKVDGKSVAVSTWAGGYTKEFATEILKGAEEFLKKRGHAITALAVHENFPVEEDLPAPAGEPRSYGPASVREEEMMHPDRDEERNNDLENWSEEEINKDKREEIRTSVPQKVRQAVRRMHRGLGHPSRTTFLKMLKLGGASKAACSYARAWVCPTCAASAAPHKPTEASTRLRPYGFNTTVVMDLKYLKDAGDTNNVALSVI